jgi:2-polyprenyl-3-methyl-5-hydroxy-6-metoxy-1,4-benzoquinol methylase
MTCPVCEGDRFVATPVAGLPLRRCLSCGLSVSDFAESNRTETRAVDSEVFEHAFGRLRRSQGQAIVAMARAHVADGDWLDVGCGYGYAVESATSGGFRGRGIEPDDGAAIEARSRGLDVERGFLSDATEPADVISTLDVLEHVQDMDAFAELVKRKARRLWVIKVPSSDGLYFRIAQTLRIQSLAGRLWQVHFEHPHRVYFNESNLRHFLTRHGFEVAAARHVPELPLRSAVERLTLDDSMPRWKACMALPVIALINIVERVRAHSDALVVLARPK